MSANNAVATAVATLVVHNNQLLLGRRFENNQFMGWQCPGGYLQKGLSIEQAAKQHCLSKAGIEITQLRPGPYSNNIFSETKHTATLYVIADAYSVKNLQIYENKQNEWSWFELDKLPELMFLPLSLLFKQYKAENINNL